MTRGRQAQGTQRHSSTFVMQHMNGIIFERLFLKKVSGDNIK